MHHFVQIFVFAFTTGLSGALLPGPLLAFTIHASAKRGALTGVWVVLGHALIEGALIVAIISGARVFLGNPVTLRAVAGVGTLALGFMGITMLRQAGKLSLSKIIASEVPPSKIENPVLGGIVLSGLNPLFLGWWVTVGLGLLTQVPLTIPNMTVFYAGHISADFGWYVFVSCLVSYGRKYTPDRAYRVFVVVCALGLLVFAVIFARTAVGA